VVVAGMCSSSVVWRDAFITTADIDIR
jgi:hypothetical protein